ncbi:MAG: low molecular weight protein-tyrosine-phosphatase [Bacteroidales bacterium]|nr:low molecular weight protein-tyrosine-phosphatase [Bacteroidales bacterium]
METKLLFVCLGNICRSPMAEGVMRHLVAQADLSDVFSIDSAGTYGGHAGELPDPRMRQAAHSRGYTLTHRSRQVCVDDFENFDLLIAMDDSNYDNLRRLAPTLEAQGRIHRMADYLTHHKADHIPDPYYGGTEGFAHVIDLLEEACANLLETLRRQRE